MKDLIKILSAVLLVTAINACTLQEVPDPTDGGGAITITAQTVQEQDVTNTPGTKTTLSGVETHWKGVDSYPGNPDKIGIFSPQARTTEGGETPIKNAEFTAQTSAKSSNFTGTMFWGADGNHDFYAYYPRNPEFTGERTVVPVSLASAQSQSEGGNSAHIGALDYMVATPLTVARGGAVNLTFNHVFAMIEFQITGSGSLSAVRLTGTNALACTGTIDLTQTPGVDDIAYTIAQTSTSQTVTVTLGSDASLSTTTAVSVFMMILPGMQSGDITIELEIGGSWKNMTKTPPAGGFVRGKKYNIAVLHDSRDGNLYSYKTIGTQVWMTENLAYLPSVVGPGTGSNSTAYYYVYGYDGTDVATAKATSNYTTYGVLYNWPAAQSACPSGWHLPSDAEWTTFTDDLGGLSVAGGKMKEAGISHWTSPNTGATNESGFTALPGGYRYYGGTFNIIGHAGHWWSSTQSSTDNAWYRYLLYAYSGVYRGNNNKGNGFSVRCLRD